MNHFINVTFLSFIIIHGKLNEILRCISKEIAELFIFQSITHTLRVLISINMSAIDLRNWDDYFFSFNQTFAVLDADWTDPKRFPKGR